MHSCGGQELVQTRLKHARAALTGHVNVKGRVTFEGTSPANRSTNFSFIELSASVGWRCLLAPSLGLTMCMGGTSRSFPIRSRSCPVLFLRDLSPSHYTCWARRRDCHFCLSLHSSDGQFLPCTRKELRGARGTWHHVGGEAVRWHRVSDEDVSEGSG